jgi:hypothetical protein
MQIFLYTDAAEIDEGSLTLLRENDFIPIRVKDENAVRILPVSPAFPVLSLEAIDAVTRSALKAIATTGYQEDVRTKFGLILSRELSAERAQAAPMTTNAPGEEG